MNENYTTFGEFVVAKRLEKGISLRKMAELMDVSAPFWSDIEKGRKNPPKLEKLEILAKHLSLADEDNALMLDLAGKERDAVAPDIPAYIMQNDYVAVALRTARDLGADEEDWVKDYIPSIISFNNVRTIRCYADIPSDCKYFRNITM